MKDPGNTANLLDLPYAPEAEAYLDELERSGQFRVGIEAEQEEEGGDATGTDYIFDRGSGVRVIQDWWTAGRLDLRVAAGLRPEDISLARVDDSLVLRTEDGLDRVTLENYLGLIPDASTLRVLFADGSEWSGAGLLMRITSWLTETAA